MNKLTKSIVFYHRFFTLDLFSVKKKTQRDIGQKILIKGVFRFVAELFYLIWSLFDLIPRSLFVNEGSFVLQNDIFSYLIRK